MEVQEAKPAVVMEIAPAPGRDAKGHFLKGSKFRMEGKVPGSGRPRKLDSRPILEAIHDEFSIDEIRAMLRKAYDTAVKMEDWKGQLAVVQFIAYYAIGKPVSRSIKATVEVDDFVNLFKGGGEEIE